MKFGADKITLNCVVLVRFLFSMRWLQYDIIFSLHRIHTVRRCLCENVLSTHVIRAKTAEVIVRQTHVGPGNQ